MSERTEAEEAEFQRILNRHPYRIKIYSTKYDDLFIELDIEKLYKELSGIFALDTVDLIGEYIRDEMKSAEAKHGDVLAAKAFMEQIGWV